ncbi:uncharacterized protein LOC126756675 [Bactrocera neohumeralis]|uniref:uncharacterized protein LOC126756675 n=1 Tax=Bactrocera neohumeralis TaxID=98809 RepID=UPI002166A7CE|nr:uncharacterized protein LOC126756675 [Bactrocera neohumeralis]XP_050325871.1 uncharacterized protein LOC126756675 [Bactrocera neohumeralis]
MDLKTGGLLVPPTVKNSSCSHPRYTSHNFIAHIGIAETIEAVLILILTLGVIGANALVIFVINNRRYSPYIHQQPRYLLTSLALNDLTIGLLITPFGLLPALFHCWPYGEIFCQIQALLRGALSQQSAVILVCMAVDRYMCALHPRKYYQHSSKKGCVAVLSLTWIISLTVFGFLVLPKGYYFNNTGLMACEPFYSKPSYRILSTCALYFPTTMVLMYCYGSSFHLSRFRLNDPTMPLTAAVHHPHLGHPPHMYQQALHAHHMQHGGMAGGGMSHHGLPPGTTTLPNTPVMNLSMAMSMGLGMGGMSGMTGMGGMAGAGGMHYGGGGVGGGGGGATASLMSGGNGGGATGGAGAGAGAGGGGPTNNVTKKIVPIQEKHSAGNTSRSMAAISLGFIVMITPWTIQEIVTACTGSKLPPFLDFVVTWIALSNSLWNPFMYWLLNSDFRRLSKRLMPNRCFPTEDTPEHKSPCCHINSDFEITTLPLPPEPPTGRPPKGGDAAGDNNGSEGGNSSSGGGGSSSRGGGGSGIRGGSVLGICARARTNSLSRSASQQARKNANSGAGGCSNSSHGHHGHSHHGGGGGGMSFTSVRPDIEGLSEKYWGEILERTVSSGSLHALTKSFPHAAPHHYYAAHHQPAHQQTFPPPPHTATMTTSFSKHSELNLNLALAEQERHAAALHDASGGGGGGGGTGALNAYELSKFSSSEPKLCEHIYHDANCAKNKSALGGGGGVTSVSGADDVKMSAGSAAVASATGRSIPDI